MCKVLFFIMDVSFDVLFLRHPLHAKGRVGQHVMEDLVRVAVPRLAVAQNIAESAVRPTELVDDIKDEVDQAYGFGGHWRSFRSFDLWISDRGWARVENSMHTGLLEDAVVLRVRFESNIGARVTP